MRNSGKQFRGHCRNWGPKAGKLLSTERRSESLVFKRSPYARGVDHHIDQQEGEHGRIIVTFLGLTIVRDDSVWTLTDSYHPAFHVGNMGFKSRRGTKFFRRF